MKKLIALAGCVALAACSQAEAPAVEETAEEAAPAEVSGTQAGMYEVTQADGTTTRSMLNADWTYEDYDADGAVSEAGTWKSADGQTCFDPTGDEPEYCFTDGEPAADGSFSVTAADGTAMTVKMVSEEAAE